MKLFGGKKGNKNCSEIVENNISDEVLDSCEEKTIVMETQEIPVITVVEDIVLPEETAEIVEETVSQGADELNVEDGMVNTIAETFGISVEELTQESNADHGKKKLTRAEKKEAKKNAKEAKKAEKKAIKQAKKEAKKWSLGKKILAMLILIFAIAITGFAGYFVNEMWVTQETLDIYDADFVGEIQRGDDIANIISVGADEEVEDTSEAVDSDRK